MISQNLLILGEKHIKHICHVIVILNETCKAQAQRNTTNIINKLTVKNRSIV